MHNKNEDMLIYVVKLEICSHKFINLKAVLEVEM